MLLLKVLFWLAVAIDAGVIGLFFILGLAAASPSKTNPLSVVAVMLIGPGLILAALAAWFLWAQSLLPRLCAFAIVASPILIVLYGQITTEIWKRNHPQEANIPTSFKPVSLASLESAVLANDPAAVTRAAAEINLRGRPEGAGVVHLALNRLAKSPEQLPVFKALLDAGANPNAGNGEPPLEIAIRISRATGPEPFTLLLKAGAKPTANTPLGTPIFFSAVLPTADPAILPLILNHGIDINTKSFRGETLLAHAAANNNWKAVLLLLERGADINQAQSPEGKPFREMVETSARIFGERGDLAEVLRKVRAQ
jgi:hypothetical protein